MNKNTTDIRHHAQIVYRVNELCKFATKKIIKPNQAKVLTALATFSNKQGTCYPAQATLASLSGFKFRETVNRIIKSLVKDGWITTQERKAVTGQQTQFKKTLAYKLNVRKITEALGSILKSQRIERDSTTSKTEKSDHTQAKKSDHTQTEKSDHINNLSDTNILKINIPSETKKKEINTIAAQNSQAKVFSNLNEKVSQCVSHELQHQANAIGKAKLTKAKAKGLKDWQIKQGIRKPDHVVKRIENESKQARNSIKPHTSQIKRFNELQNDLMQWSKSRLDVFNNSKLIELNAILSALAGKVNLSLSLVAHSRLCKFKEFINH